MRLIQIGFSLMVASFVGSFCGGCEPSSQPGTSGSQPQNSAAGAKTGPAVVEAKDATGVWNQSQVEQYLREELKLSSLALKSTGNNGYEGTAEGKDGQKFASIVVKQVPGGIKTTWSTATGNGVLTFGNPVP